MLRACAWRYPARKASRASHCRHSRASGMVGALYTRANSDAAARKRGVIASSCSSSPSTWRFVSPTNAFSDQIGLRSFTLMYLTPDRSNQPIFINS